MQTWCLAHPWMTLIIVYMMLDALRIALRCACILARARRDD